jgi:hypothetical protein
VFAGSPGVVAYTYAAKINGLRRFEYVVLSEVFVSGETNDYETREDYYAA